MVTFLLMITFILILPPVDNYLDSYMPFHYSVQLGGAIATGIMTGLSGSWFKKIITTKYTASSLLFFIGTITFWMIPRSMDLAVNNNFVDTVMFFNLYLASLLLGVTLVNGAFVLKSALGIYGLSMLLTMGIIFTQYETILCAVYTLEMQKETGKVLLILFSVFFLLFLFRSSRSLITLSNKQFN